MEWFALYTKPRSEKKLASIFEEKQVSFYLPTYTALRQWSDRKKKVIEPLIKRIIFIQSEIEEINNFYKYPLVAGIIKEFGKPAIIKPHEIETLKIITREWDGETIKSGSDITFKPGDQVAITRGPFTGLEGTLSEEAGKHRLVIKLESLNVEFTVNIPKSQTKKIK